MGIKAVILDIDLFLRMPGYLHITFMNWCYVLKPENTKMLFKMQYFN